MRDIKPPTDVDSLGKLTEWLAECGMPQRDCLQGDIGSPAYGEAERCSLGGGPFIAGDREGATQAYRALIQLVAQAFHVRFSYMDSQRLVWRTRPHLSEVDVTRVEDAAGRRVDPRNWLDDGTMKVVSAAVAVFDACFWLEVEAA